MPITQFSERSIERLRETTRIVLGTAPLLQQRPVDRSPALQWYWGKLTSDLSGASDGLTSPTSATFDIWVPNGTSTPPLTFIRSTNTDQQGLTVYNRFAGVNALSGTIIQVEFAYGEWTLKGVDCPS